MNNERLTELSGILHGYYQICLAFARTVRGEEDKYLFRMSFETYKYINDLSIEYANLQGKTREPMTELFGIKIEKVPKMIYHAIDFVEKEPVG